MSDLDRLFFRVQSVCRGRMTKIVYYLDCLATSRSYEPDELARLQGAYDSARKLLDLDDTDPRRQQVALLVFTLAEKAASPDQLAAVVADAFRDK